MVKPEYMNPCKVHVICFSIGRIICNNMPIQGILLNCAQSQRSAKYHSHWNLQRIFQHFYAIELWSITVRGETNKIRQSNNTQQSPEFSVQKRNKKNVLSLNISFQHQSMLGDEWLWSLIAIIPKKLQLSLISISRIFLVLSFIFLATIWTISATDEARTQKKYLHKAAELIRDSIVKVRDCD